MKSQDDEFCRAANQLAYVTTQQIEQCRQLQQELANHKPIARIFVEQQYLSAQQVANIARYLAQPTAAPVNANNKSVPPVALQQNMDTAQELQYQPRAVRSPRRYNPLFPFAITVLLFSWAIYTLQLKKEHDRVLRKIATIQEQYTLDLSQNRNILKKHIPQFLKKMSKTAKVTGSIVLTTPKFEGYLQLDHLFSGTKNYAANLDRREIPQSLRQKLQSLSPYKLAVTILNQGHTWLISDKHNKLYVINWGNALQIYRLRQL